MEVYYGLAPVVWILAIASFPKGKSLTSLEPGGGCKIVAGQTGLRDPSRTDAETAHRSYRGHHLAPPSRAIQKASSSCASTWNFLGVFLGPVVVVGCWLNGESLDPIQASVPQGPIIVDTILVPKKIKQHILQILLGHNSRDYF
ncbi:predicted protein [Histoplasma capsulatum var. duboisii H88]|uniref:Predicted protein n=1 Tax=Ajellomyces capsulatus (strain H88) TaxID=544711 RepID=F0UJM1_AJEC8|nr:predicted protein [Histoplasma capsulatum var. duboisii H88]